MRAPGRCASPRALSASSEGDHTFTVRASTPRQRGRRPRGHAPSPRTPSVAPDTTILTGPAGWSPRPRPRSPSASRNLAPPGCSFDDGPWAPCTCRWSASTRMGRTFRARATDAAGNVDPCRRAAPTRSTPSRPSPRCSTAGRPWPPPPPVRHLHRRAGRDDGLPPDAGAGLRRRGDLRAAGGRSPHVRRPGDRRGGQPTAVAGHPLLRRGHHRADGRDPVGAHGRHGAGGAPGLRRRRRGGLPVPPGRRTVGDVRVARRLRRAPGGRPHLRGPRAGRCRQRGGRWRRALVHRPRAQHVLAHHAEGIAGREGDRDRHHPGSWRRRRGPVRRRRDAAQGRSQARDGVTTSAPATARAAR